MVYNDALNDFHNEYYSRAKGKFEQVKLRFPGHAYVGRFIAESQAAIDAGKDKTRRPRRPRSRGCRSARWWAARWPDW